MRGEGKGADKEEKAALLSWETRSKERAPRSGLPSYRQRGVEPKGQFQALSAADKGSPPVLSW